MRNAYICFRFATVTTDMHMDICQKVLFSSTRQIFCELFPRYQQLFDVTL